MHVTLASSALAAAVSYAAKALPARPTEPLYSGLRVTAADGALTFAGFDPSDRMTAVVTVPAQVDEPGEVLVGGKLLADIAANLPTGDVTFAEDGTRVKVTAGKARFVLPKMPMNDYPTLPARPAALGTVAAAEFARAVEQVAFAAGGDAAMPVLTGVRMEISGTTITLVATDRYRLAVRTLTWEPSDKNVSMAVTVPAKHLADAVKGLARDGDVLSLGLDEHELLAVAGNTRTATVGGISGDYPHWQVLLPANATSTAVVHTKEVAEALARVALVREHNQPVRATFGDDALELAAGAGTTDGDSSGEDTVGCELSGPGLTIGFNPGFFRDGLAACGTDQVQVQMTLPGKPALIVPVGMPGYRYLVMPVRLAAA